MRQEPELIDIFALFALMSILNKAGKGVLPQDIARSAYDFAEAMIEEKEYRNV